MSFTFGLAAAILLAPLCLALPVHAADASRPVLSVQGDRFQLDGKTIDLWGIRVAGATRDQKQTDHLIAHLDEYKAHGVNAITVFYQGCRNAAHDPFSTDGTSIDPAHQKRMEQILDACATRNMVVIVGIFYQAAPFGLKDAAAVRMAVRTVAGKLRPWRNVIINIANEQNSAGWKSKAAIYDFTDPENILALCRLVREVDGVRLVGGGGYDHAKSEVIGRSKDCDVLLFDTAGPEDSAKLYQRFIKAGVENKPIVNVETFGGWTKKFPHGVFPEEARKEYLREVDAAAAIPGLSLFFHNNPWCQNADGPARYDLGGDGTTKNPGIRWYFEHVKGKQQPR
jgi:hypothetical protein